MKNESRLANGFEFRAGDDGEGIFEGYAVTWDFVDSYRSMFKRGAFAKTLQERGDRVKVKYNHETLIGKVLEAREDDTGLYVRGQLNLAVQSAKDVYSFLVDGTLDGLSFAFRSIKDHYEKGVRVFDEVALFEFGPVDDPASDAAIVTDVRSDDGERATNYTETYEDDKARRDFWMAFWALERTIDDIWFSDSSGEDLISMLDAALTEAHGQLLESAQMFVDRFRRDSQRAMPENSNSNALALAVRDWLQESGQSPERVAANSSLTLDEVNDLRSGRIVADRTKLTGLPDDVQAAHRDARRVEVERLCTELRDGLSNAEHQRINALLSRNKSEPDDSTRDDTQPGMTALLVRAQKLRESIGA